MSKPPAPTIQSISANICWMKTSLYIQIPLELRWLQIQGWLSCPAEIHDAAPQLPCSIPGPHLRLSSTELLLQRVGLRRDPTQLLCPQLCSALSALWLWLPPQPDLGNDSAQGINKMEFPPSGRGMSSRWAVKYQHPAVTALECHYLTPQVIKAKISHTEFICSVLIHLLLVEGNHLKAAEIMASGHLTTHEFQVSSQISGMYSSNLKSENLCQTPFPVLHAYFFCKDLQRFVWNYW